MLGGGYVSVWAYRSIVRRLRAQLADGRVAITIVCPLEHHYFHGWTAETLTGILREEGQESPLSEILPQAHLLRGQAVAVDTATNTVAVELADGSRQSLGYDHLLLGIGSTDSSAVAGTREWGYQIKARDAFQRTQQAIQNLVRQAATESAEVARRTLTFTVAGGGFTGVELATNLVEYVGVLKKQYPSLWFVQPRVRLVHSGDRVLSALQPDYGRLIAYAERTMAEYGIEIIANRRIVRVTPNGAFLDDDTFLPSRMVISTVGQSRIRLSGTESMARDAMERVITNTYQQIPGHPNVWGGGDACHVKFRQTEEPCPANALWAIKHGEYVGRNIARAIKGQALRPFTYPGLGQAASLGLGKGIAELYGIPFTGALAWVMRWFFFLYFMPSRRRMVGALSDWLFLLFRRQRKGLWLNQPAKVGRTSPLTQAVPELYG